MSENENLQNDAGKPETVGEAAPAPRKRGRPRKVRTDEEAPKKVEVRLPTSVLAGTVLQSLGSSILLFICAAGFTAMAVLLLFNKAVREL